MGMLTERMLEEIKRDDAESMQKTMTSCAENDRHILLNELRELKNALFVETDRNQRGRTGWKLSQEENKAAHALIKLLDEQITSLRDALEEARRELSNYTRGEMGGENRSVTEVIDVIDAALTPTSERT